MWRNGGSRLRDGEGGPHWDSDPQGAGDGQFYASNGPFLEVAEVKRGVLRVEGSTITRIRFIGAGGEVLSTVEGGKGRFVVPKTGYVRAVAEDLAGRKAWVQPVWKR